MYFPSKKDIWLGTIIWGSILFMIAISLFDDPGWRLSDVLESGICLLISAFLLWLWFGTGYKVEEGVIKIKYGPFRSTVEIKKIRKLRATKNPLAAPALSIDRIEILYGKYDIAIVSPKYVTDFIDLLTSENAKIQIDEGLLQKVEN